MSDTNLKDRAHGFFELLALAAQYADGYDPLGLAKTLHLNDRGKTSTMSARFENSPQRLISVIKQKIQAMAKAAEQTSEMIDEPSVVLASQKVITPDMARAIDGVSVKEIDSMGKQASEGMSIQDIIQSRQVGRQRDPIDGRSILPGNLDTEVLGLVRQGTVDSPHMTASEVGELSNLYRRS